MQGHSKVSQLIALIFFMGLWLPLLALIFPAINVSPKIKEMRRLAVRPDFEILSPVGFIKKYQLYFDDHFGFRKQLVRLHSLIKFKVFDVSGVKKVLVGRDGWLFYTGNSVVDDYRGVNQLSINDLEKWRSVLENKKKWLGAQGIEYVFVVAPNKHSIYPEFLPDGIRKVNLDSPLDQLLEYLNKTSDVEIIDLRGAIMAQKDKGLLYFPTGTHWNSEGAFLGYGEIISRVAQYFPNITPLVHCDMKIIAKKRPGLGLASMLGIQDLFTEEIRNLVPIDKKYILKEKRNRLLVMENSNKSLPRAVMFRDSFTIRLIPYLSQNFSYIKYLSMKWYQGTPIQEIINKDKPDIVIEEWCERFIKNMKVVSFDRST